LKLAFQSFDDVFRFFDVLSNGKISKEHFWICIGTFNIDITFTDTLNLFEHLDVSRDGYLELTEMMNGLFPRGFGMSHGNPNYQNLHDHNNP
jgi:Ca2+-binding EF-hand superfamily protein